jgi:hypothetical protein
MMFEQDVYLPSLATGQNLFDESSLTHTWPDTKGAESKSLDCRTLPLTPRVLLCVYISDTGLSKNGVYS